MIAAGEQGLRRPTTEAEKRAAFKAGHYRFVVPPVCHAAWDDDAWIAFIDASNGWELPAVAERPDFLVENHGSVVIVTPQNDTAAQWVRDNVQVEGWQRWAVHGIAVEPRYVADLVAGIVADGFYVMEA